MRKRSEGEGGGGGGDDGALDDKEETEEEEKERKMGGIEWMERDFQENDTNRSNIAGTFNRSRNVREKVQTWMTGLVTEVRKKSPSMVHRWMTMSGDQRVVAVATEVPPGQDPQDGQTGSLERIDESATEPSAAGLRSTIKSKLNLNEFYDKLTKTPRDISGLFQRNKRMERHSTMIGEAQSSGRDQLGTDIVGGSEDEDEEDGDDEEEEGRRMGNTSSPKNLNDEDFLFSFEDFSCIAKTPSSASQNRDMMGLDSGCCEEQGRVKPRRLNIGEIGRSASAKHPDSGIDLGSSGCGVGGGGNKRQLLSDIGRRFSEMDESSNCEFRSDSLRQVVGSQPSMQFRPNSVPVSPRPRMILPSQHHHHHRDSSDFSVNMKKRNSLFREYSTQSDSSRCSSVESLLESRRPDAETILINLGFGPVQSDDVLSRLPKRFLKPSQVKGIDTEDFLKQQQLATSLHEQSVLGYRGLVGNCHSPSLMVAKIMQRFQANEHQRFLSAVDNGRPASAPPSPSSAHA